MKVRIGIDVGGTFTDAVVIDNDTYEIIGTVKVPTTHTAAEGVALGIIEALRKVMTECNIDPDDVLFIAHGTTQATNALLEGDVCKVGIVTLGEGVGGSKSRIDTVIGDIELAAGKYLHTANAYISTAKGAKGEDVGALAGEALNELRQAGCGSMVAAEAFSVDDPANEEIVVAQCVQNGVPGTATNHISKLYGLRIRTRTAAVNASIMPKMLDAANMTEQSIKQAKIKTPLMVMRCDGGVMTVDEVRRRPILTTLSGPAAGVAGALMYEKVTDGIFFEVGGTSTDISCIKDGKVIVKYAEIGGHKTYLNSLDVRTVGIGGGSMIQLKDGKAVNTGPRSAHIAGLEYEVYTTPDRIADPVLKAIMPKPGDPDYAYVSCSNGAKFALTLAGAANICGYAKEGDYAFGSAEAARKAWAPLAASMGLTVEEAAAKAMLFSANKNQSVAKALIEDYHMDPRTTVFVGGGGGAAAVVPHLAGHMGAKWRIAQNAAVISTIGVALAMVRDMVERIIINPTQADILAVRREAELMAVKSGAAPDSVEVSVEVDTQRNLVRAIAMGATELRAKAMTGKRLTEDQLLAIVAENLDVPKERLFVAQTNGSYSVVQYENAKKRLLGLFTKRTYPTRLIDDEGVIRLQKKNAVVQKCSISKWQPVLRRMVEDNSIYGDSGQELPNVYAVLGKRLIDLSGLSSTDHIVSVTKAELSRAMEDEELIILCSSRLD